MIDEKVKDQFLSNIRFKEICVSSLSRFFSFSKEQIIKYKEVLNFDRMLLMENKEIHWDFRIFYEVEEKLDWSAVWKLKDLELGFQFFRDNDKKLDFDSIHLHPHVDWSNQLLDEFEDKWDFERLSIRPILGNPRNIRKYADRLDWKQLSKNKNLKLDEALLDKFVNQWQWNELCVNPAFKISVAGIEKYRDYIDWKSLSANPSMFPFIMAHRNNYPWVWSSFAKNPALIFNDKIIDFLVLKIKKEFHHFEISDETKESWAKTKIIRFYSRALNPDLEVIRISKLAPFIPYGYLIKTRPELLSKEELIENWNFEHCRNIIPNRVMRQFPLSYIKENWDSFSEYHHCVFRNGKIDREFLDENIKKDDWFQLAFNENFEWTTDFLIENLDRFESNFGLSQNRKIFDTLFCDATQSEISNLLNNY